MQPIRESWDRIEKHLAAQNQALLRDLSAPASASQMARLSSAFGYQLPAAFIASLAVHDGQRGKAEPLFGDYEYFSSERMVAEWRIWNDLAIGGDFADAQAAPGPGVRPCWWHPGWLPFCGNGGGDHLCLDLEPAPGGTRGQIVTLWHDDEARRVQAGSFAAWLAQFAQQLF